MRELKQVRNFVGLAMLTAFGPQAKVQEARQVANPIEKITVEASTLDWSEMLRMQASLPEMALIVPAEMSTAFEAPPIEIALPKSGAKRLSSETVGEAGGQENMGFGPCTGFASEPPVGLAMDSQLDVADGMGFSFIPPDVSGAVGPAHLMTMLNNKVLITDRLGGNAVSVDTSVFWSPLGTTPASPTTTFPRVLYDDTVGRWYALIRNGVPSLGTTTLFFAISRTDDPTGTWDYYAIAGDPTFATQIDWTNIGYNGTWIVLSGDQLNLAGTAFAGGPKLWAIDKSSALNPGGPITVSIFANFMGTIHPGAAGSRIMPARTLDANSTLWFVNDAFTAGGVFLYQLTQMTGTGGSPVVSGLAGSPFGGTTSFCYSTTNFSGTQRTMAQIGDPRFITPFSVRVASVCVRNGKIWVANSGGLPGPSTNTAPTSNGVIWHQIDPTLPFPSVPGDPLGMVLQSGAITNGTNTMSMYPSIAVNCADDVLIGYANGDATISPRACYSMRLGTDLPNSMGAIQELKAGESVYWKNFGVGTTAQYGRYTATCVDPNDDKTLWTLQEYADQRVATPGVDNDSRWGTHWGRLGDCDELPVVTDDPDSFLGCIGDPVTFTVAGTSTLPLQYQWRKNGIDILGETTDTLSFASTVASDAGSYDCVICGCGKTASAAATLAFAAPSVTTQPNSLVVKIGDPASFFVAGTGSGTLSYQWYLDGNPIALATSDTYSIAAVAAADYGNYTCIITDDCGPVTSDVAKLEPPVVNHTLPAELSFQIFQSPKSQLGCVDGSVTLEVQASPAGVTYEWRKDGSPIVPPETGSTLTLSPLTVGDAGSYDVVVSLGSRTRVSAAAALTIGDKPVITVQPTPPSQTVAPGGSVTYSVTATGGTLTYQWKKKSNAPFTSYNDIPGATGPSLTIEPINAGDAGLYRCHVRNECGQTISNACRIIVP